MTGPARLCGTGVANEHQLRRQIEAPYRQRRLEMWYRHRPHPEFRAVRTDERGDLIGWLPCRRIARDRRPASVVAMEAKPGIGVQFGAAERPDHEAALGTHQAGAGNAAVRRVARGHAETVAIHSNTCQRPKPRAPRDFILNVSRAARLDHRILPDGAEPSPRFGVIEPDVRDVVVSDLDAEGVLNRVTTPPL